MGVDIGPLGNLEQLIGGFDLAVLADAQEEDAVDGGLDGVIELAFGAVEVGRGFGGGGGGAEVAQGDIAGEQEAPLLDLFEEFRVHLGGAAFSLGALGVAVE